MPKIFSYRKDVQRNDVIRVGKVSVALTGGDETVPLRTLGVIVGVAIVAVVVLSQVLIHLLH
jgi:hypothetical protein